MNKRRGYPGESRLVKPRSEIRTYMIDRISFRPTSLLLLFVVLFSAPSFAQSPPEPVREQLLNGLTVLYWNRPGDSNVLLKLRIHSGADFDLTDKGGAMALMGDALFPDPATAEYVSEQLGGKLEVSTDYDAINVTISGKASEFERLVDLLRSALVSTPPSIEAFAKIRDLRIKQLSSRQSIITQADEAVAKRLFGSFPYGHPSDGTPESVARVERADLLLSRERFLNADNSELAVVGPVDKGRVMRTLRQLLGPWQKSDGAVPATFRSASPPDSRILLLDRADATRAEVRVAVRGLARSDRDDIAASLLALIVRDRWRASSPNVSSPFARHEANLLPGMFVIGGSVSPESAAKAITAGQQVLLDLAQNGPTAEELERARSTLVAEINKRLSTPESTVDFWLDVDAYKLPPPNLLALSVSNLAIADVQRTAKRLFLNTSFAKVAVGKIEQLTPALQDGFEVLKNKVEVRTTDSAPSKKP
jgi:zinc protease